VKIRSLCALVVGIAVLAFPSVSVADGVIMYVNQTGDQSDLNPGDGFCDWDNGTSGEQCTLRAAIQEANAGSGLDAIWFSIDFGTNIPTITPGTALPTITSRVWLQGETEPGTALNQPGVEINASNETGDGLRLGAGSADSIVSGFIINRSPGYGLRLDSATPVSLCWIGTDKTGLAASPNASGGILVTTSGVSIGMNGRNVISGNNGNGITVTGGPVTITKNFIGTDLTGNALLGNTGAGISIADGATGDVIGTTDASTGNVISGNGAAGIDIDGSTGVSIASNTIGVSLSGNTPLANAGGGIQATDAPNAVIGAARNVISSNTGAGVTVDGSSSGAVVKRNYIGLRPNGSTASGNTTFGVVVSSAGVQVGGADESDANTVSANGNGGVRVTANGATVVGNYIGTAATGLTALGNAGPGIKLDGVSSGTVGGVDQGNVVAANTGPAIELLQTAGVTIRGNLIGMDKNLSADSTLGNGDGTGPSIALGDGVTGTTIGGEQDGERNTVTGTKGTGAGVALSDAGSGNAIIANVIYGNGGLAIDLMNDGVTPNDADDADTGPNGLTNFPVLTNAVRAAATIHIEGTLDVAPGAGTYRVEFFANSACDVLGAGEAAGRVGATDVSVDSAGNGSFSVDITASTPTNETAISAIATSPGGDSSEMSPCISALPAGTAQFSQGSFAGDESAGPATIIVTRSGRTDTTVTVDYATFDGTAKSPDDYAAQTGTLTFGPGETLKSFQIPIVDDHEKEDLETVLIELSHPINATVGSQSKTTLLISDDESRPTFTLLPSETPPAPTVGGRTPVVPAKKTKKTYCVVPKLKGLTKKKAAARLKKAHCKLGKATKSKKKAKSPKLKNKVIAQKPKASKKKRKSGTKVAVTLGR
jgi:CSLREA domain-containing protein